MATRADVARRVSRSPGVRMRLAGHGRYGLRHPRDYAATLAEWVPTGGVVYPASELEAMGLPPFGRGVELLASTLAGLEWRAVRWVPEQGIYQRIPDQPSVLVDPYPAATPWLYKWAAVEDLILYGNHLALYGELDSRTRRPGWLVPLPADEVWILTDPGNPGWFEWTIAGETFTVDEVFHVSSGNRSGEMLGRGVMRQYSEWLGGAVAAETHAAGYYAGGALPPAVLQSPTVVTNEQAAGLKAKWREMTTTREPVILPSGYVLTPLVSSAETSQLVESRRWDAELVAQLLGVPSWKLGLPGPSMTYQNVDQADIVWIQDSVDRWAQPLAAAFTKWLTPHGTLVRWDYAGRLRADTKTTAETLSVLVAAGIITKDEARAVLGRPPLDETEDEGTTPVEVPELTPQEVA